VTNDTPSDERHAGQKQEHEVKPAGSSFVRPKSLDEALACLDADGDAKILPQAPRPFRVPLYPVLPLIFCATSALLLYASVVHTRVGAVIGVGVLAAGVGVLALLGGVRSPDMKTSTSEGTS
jgi:hypothetical protein